MPLQWSTLRLPTVLCISHVCILIFFWCLQFAHLPYAGGCFLLYTGLYCTRWLCSAVCFFLTFVCMCWLLSVLCAFLGCFLVALPNNCVGCQWYLFLASLPPYPCGLFWLLLLLLLHFAGRHCVLHLRGFSCHCWHVALCRGPAIIPCRVAICFILLFRVCTVSIVTLISTYAWPAEQYIVSSIVSTMLYGLPAGLCFFRLAQCCMGFLPDYVVSSLYC